MQTNVFTTTVFIKQSKRLLKKYRSLKHELELLEKELLINPKHGTSIGNNTFKIRLAIKSKGKGKRGGLRVITHLDIFLFNDEIVNDVYLLSIYDKSQTANISKKEILNIIKPLNKNDWK